MIDYYSKNGKNIRYKLSEKKDKCVVLLHGYLETLEVWDDFAALLSEYYTVVALDLPGHGESSYVEDNSMDIMAESIFDLLRHLKFERVFIIGHSMGGYVANAFTLNYTDMVEGHVLFHSNTFADSADKKQNRRKEIELIRQGKLGLICMNAIPNTFGVENINTFAPVIKRITACCSKHNPEGIVSCLHAMIDRKDTTLSLSQLNIPILSIIGAKDKFIDLQTSENLAAELGADTCLLRDTGHMGFIEEKQHSCEVLHDWIQVSNIQ